MDPRALSQFAVFARGLPQHAGTAREKIIRALARQINPYGNGKLPYGGLGTPAPPPDPRGGMGPEASAALGAFFNAAPPYGGAFSPGAGAQTAAVPFGPNAVPGPGFADVFSPGGPGSGQLLYVDQENPPEEDEGAEGTIDHHPLNPKKKNTGPK